MKPRRRRHSWGEVDTRTEEWDPPMDGWSASGEGTPFTGRGSREMSGLLVAMGAQGYNP